jgi:hypothetical protein
LRLPTTKCSTKRGAAAKRRQGFWQEAAEAGSQGACAAMRRLLRELE